MKKGKKFNGPRFAALYDWEMNLPAYRLMSVYGRALLMEFRMAYTGYNNGDIIMSIRQAANLLNCNKDTALKYLTELQDKGWVCQTAKGYFTQKTDKTASTWRITNQPIGHGVEVPETKEYAKWKPPEKQNPVPASRTSCATSSDQRRKRGPTKPDRTPPNCATTSDRDDVKTPTTGPTTSYTYISTTGEGDEGQPESSPTSPPKAVNSFPEKRLDKEGPSTLSVLAQALVQDLKQHQVDGTLNDKYPEQKMGDLAS